MSNSNIRVSKGVFFKDSVRVFLRVFLYIGVALLALYLLFAMFLLRVIPSPDLGFTPVKNITHEGGIVPVGEEVIVNLDEELNDSILGSLKQAFIPLDGDAEVEVLTKNYGEIRQDDTGLITVDGVEVGVGVIPEGKEFLEDEYFVECIQGACSAGDILIIKDNNIYGERL